jgi:hypothetical protein
MNKRAAVKVAAFLFECIAVSSFGGLANEASPIPMLMIGSGVNRAKLTQSAGDETENRD